MPAAFTPIGTIPLRGPGGEPVDLWRTILSHGVASLPPHRVDEERRTFTSFAVSSAQKLGSQVFQRTHVAVSISLFAEISMPESLKLR